MRADRWLSHALYIPRKEAQKCLKQRRLRINGKVTTAHNATIREEDVITFDNEPLVLVANTYFMVHKPVDYVCATTDPVHPTVFALVEHPAKSTLHVVGRLDIDTTGLVLLTSDGDWTHRITSPNKECNKTYLVTLADPLADDAILALEAGVMLRNEDKPTKPAKLMRQADNVVRITITEGRYHQVKRMFAAVGNKVVNLHRECIGEIELGDLSLGACRELTATEIASVK